MIRLALVGLGAVTRNIHLPAYARLRESVTVVAGCDVDRRAVALVGKKWEVPEVFHNPEEMIDKTRPDIVAICTPPDLHHEQCLMALEHGCHVFCEKPAAESLEQVDDMLAASRRHRRHVVVNSQFPYMNIHASSKRCFGSAEFGRLLFLHAWQTFRPTGDTEAGWRGAMKRRLCFEFGVQVFELIRFFFDGDPARIFCHMPDPSRHGGPESLNILSLEFADGRAASVVLDRLSKGPECYLAMRLDGEHASIQTCIGGEARCEIGIHPKAKRPFLGLHLTKGGKAVLQNGEKAKIIAKDGFNPFASATATHFRNFVNAVEDGKTPRGSLRHHRNTLALALAAYDSAQTGRMVDLAPYLEEGSLQPAKSAHASPTGYPATRDSCRESHDH